MEVAHQPLVLINSGLSLIGIHSLNVHVAETMPGFSFVLICAVLFEEKKSEKIKTEKHGLSSVFTIK